MLRFARASSRSKLLFSEKFFLRARCARQPCSRRAALCFVVVASARACSARQRLHLARRRAVSVIARKIDASSRKILAASTRLRSRDVDRSSSARRTQQHALCESACRCDALERAAVDALRSRHKNALFWGKSRSVAPVSHVVSCAIQRECHWKFVIDDGVAIRQRNRHARDTEAGWRRHVSRVIR